MVLKRSDVDSNWFPWRDFSLDSFGLRWIPFDTLFPFWVADSSLLVFEFDPGSDPWTFLPPDFCHVSPMRGGFEMPPLRFSRNLATGREIQFGGLVSLRLMMEASRANRYYWQESLKVARASIQEAGLQAGGLGSGCSGSGFRLDAGFGRAFGWLGAD